VRRAEALSEHIFGTCVLAPSRASMSMSRWWLQASCAVGCASRAPSAARAHQDLPSNALELVWLGTGDTAHTSPRCAP
jgi:hypothetical protein